MSCVSKDSYSLVALDMDGTLLDSNHRISDHTLEILRRASAAGKHVVLSSGRCLNELREYLAAGPGIRFVICENGACVHDIDLNRRIRQLYLPEGDVRDILEMSVSMDACRQCFLDNHSYVECTNEDDLYRYHIHDFASVFRTSSTYVSDLNATSAEKALPFEKINLYFSTDSERAHCRQLLAGRPLLLADSIGLGLEISPLGASKSDGLRALCDHLGIPLSQTIAVGDGGNDIDLLEAAGLAVAMGNAIPQVRAVADVVTEDCDHDGAALAIERLMLDH